MTTRGSAERRWRWANARTSPSSKTARGGILQRGIGVLHNDVAVVTNVSADHLDLHGIRTVDQLAEVKGTIVRITRPDGWDVLNADDPRVLAMRRHAAGRPWVYSLDPHHPAIRETLAEGGRATTVLDGRIAWSKTKSSSACWSTSPSSSWPHRLEYKADQIFDPDERVNLKPATVREILRLLERYNLSDTSNDIKGIAFERFLGRTFRGEIGQFFTPRTIVEFTVQVVEPKEGDVICDPASGSGGFLIRFFEIVREQIMADVDHQYQDFKG